MNTLTGLQTCPQRLSVKITKQKVDSLLSVTSLISLQSISLTHKADPRNGLLPATHEDVFTLTSPVCIVHDYVILNVCKISLSFSLRLSLARTLFQPSSKKGDFIPPLTCDTRLFLRFHASYITRLKQGCCNERYLEGTRSLRNSSICYREDFANPQLKAKIQCCIKSIHISSSHTKL